MTAFIEASREAGVAAGGALGEGEGVRHRLWKAYPSFEGKLCLQLTDSKSVGAPTSAFATFPRGPGGASADKQSVSNEGKKRKRGKKPRPFNLQTKGGRIRYAREAVMGLTQEELAGELGLTRGSVGGWERNTGITLEHLEAIAQKCGVTLEWLSKGAGDPPPPNALAEADSRAAPVPRTPESDSPDIPEPTKELLVQFAVTMFEGLPRDVLADTTAETIRRNATAMLPVFAAQLKLNAERAKVRRTLHPKSEARTIATEPRNDTNRKSA